ncbi:MAG: chitosanase [Bacteroidota bacterium]|nr:chitosanase [Bacteroidota bacterium]
MITETHKQLIQRVINVFETGTPDGKYDMLVVYPDGKDGSRQITYGRSQTTEQGNLSQLLMMYIKKGGIYADDLSLFMEHLGKKPLANDEAFKDLLKLSAREDPIMRETQDEFFDIYYYNPAFQFFTENSFTLPLGLLVIYDSYIHSGGVLRKLRKLFGEYPPAKGGDEKKWTYSYVDVRHQWLKYHSNPLLQKTIYRTQCFKDQIAADNWNLDKLPIMANGVAVNI